MVTVLTLFVCVICTYVFTCFWLWLLFADPQRAFKEFKAATEDSFTLKTEEIGQIRGLIYSADDSFGDFKEDLMQYLKVEYKEQEERKLVKISKKKEEEEDV